jgi:hypothetical protein
MSKGTGSKAHKDIDISSEFNDFAVPIILKLNFEALAETGLLDALFNGSLSGAAV